MRKRRRKEINGAALKKIERKGVDRGTCPPLMLECRRLEVVFTGLWAAPPSRLRQLISGSGAGGGHNLWQGGAGSGPRREREQPADSQQHTGQGSQQHTDSGQGREATTRHTHSLDSSHQRDIKVQSLFCSAHHLIMAS